MVLYITLKELCNNAYQIYKFCHRDIILTIKLYTFCCIYNIIISKSQTTPYIYIFIIGS